MSRNLDDFFEGKNKYREESTKEERREKPKRNNKDNFIVNFLRKNFSFDYNVDLVSETSVLHRRNVVINHIASIVNLVFLLFSFVGIKQTNIVINIAFWLLMTGLSLTISMLLRRYDAGDPSKQKLIMFLECFYLLIMSFFLYIKIWLGFRLNSTSLEFTPSEVAILDASYLLIYLTVIIMGFYQKPLLLRVMFLWVFIVLSIINIAFVHSELFSNATNMSEFLEYMFVTNKNISIDILLRTLIMLVFFVILYSSVSISNYIERQRASEHTQRLDVETNYVDVVESVFTAVKVYNASTDDNIKQAISSKKIMAVVKVLSKAMNYTNEQIEEIREFSIVHVEKMNVLSLQNTDSKDFDEITSKTKIASEIMKRLQISKKAEDITTAVFENRVTPGFVINMNKTQNDDVSRIILIASIYDNLRDERLYHTALNHQRSIEMIKVSFEEFFKADLVSRFIKYNSEIEEAYRKAS